jgi:hypothetical protein
MKKATRKKPAHIHWDRIACTTCMSCYGSRQAVHPASGYEQKAGPAVFHGHRSVIKDSLTVDDQSFPRIYSNKTADNLARTDSGLAGPAFESEMFSLATGMDIDEAGLEQMAGRVFNLERALRVRNWGRSREVDEQVIPAFDQMENWTNPYVGKRQRLDRKSSLPCWTNTMN